MIIRAFKALLVLLVCIPLSQSLSAQCDRLYIAGVMDGSLSGGLPKMIQVCANDDIADMSIYGLGSANNGGGSDGEEFTFPAMAASAGDCFTVASETTQFSVFFGCSPNFVNTTATSINGDDAVELFCMGTAEDVFGDINVDGTGQAWEYMDSWAVATDAIPEAVFNIANWNISPPNSLDGATDNATAMFPYPNAVCSNCSIDMITAGTQTACDPAANDYDQEITITYTDEPGTGMLTINGQSYAITGSPQIINLTGLFADGNPVTVDASFDANPSCALVVPDLFTAPAACVIIPPSCEIEISEVSNYSCNDDNTINIDVCFDYQAPLSGSVNVDVDGALFGTFPYPFSSPGCISLTNVMKSMSGNMQILVYDASTTPTGAVFMSEFHYDNAGTDSNEFIEVSGNAGTNLTGYSIELYNGSNGTSYSTLGLSGTLTNSGNGCGTFVINIPPNGIQNGSPDGMALVDAGGNVLEFLSYEGAFVANDGPAIGMMSVDVGVNEGGGDPVGTSISLTDLGWEFTAVNSEGVFNPGLTCSEPCNDVISYSIPSNPPSFACPSDKTIQLEPGLCGEITKQPTPEVIDDCGASVVTQIGGPMPGDFIDIFDSPYTYEYEVVDSDGNTASCSFNLVMEEYRNAIDIPTCNDHVYLTADINCEAEINADLMLEGGPYGCYDLYGILIEPVVGETNMVQVTITDPNSGLSCWGYVTIEDKNDPEIDCEICPEVDGMSMADYPEECLLHCYEQPVLQLRYDDGLRDDLIQEDYEDFAEDAMTDNCDNWNEEDVSFYDIYESLGACVGTRMKRTWTVGFNRADGSRGTVSCTREYFFRPMDLSTATTYDTVGGFPIIEPIEDSLVLPVERIELPCGVDIAPAGIAAFFDIPATIDRDTDDNNIDPDELDIDLVVENNEGYPWAYPHYYQDGVGPGGPHAQKIDNEVCNLISGYTDTEIEVCELGCFGNRKVLREWTILDWCTGEFIRHQQIIKSVDTNPPFMDIPDAYASVDPWNCTATVYLPAPEHMGDDCDDDVTYTIGFTGGYTVTGDAETGYILHELPLGSHTIEYLSEDCCGNVGRAEITVVVVDETAPVAVTKQFIVIGLTNVGNTVDEFQGFAKLYAEDVDNESYDGCTDVILEVRRTPVCESSDSIWGPFVTFCCEDLMGGASTTIDVELRITDEYGNSNIVWASVLVEDKSATTPQIPPHMYLTCDMDYNDFSITGGIPRFFGACGEADIECDTLSVYENTEPRELRASDGVFINGVGPIVAPEYDPSCGFGAVRRQFRDCGGGTQWFVILPLDPFDDTTIVWPDDVTVDCDAYEFDEPYWEESTCNLVGIKFRSRYIFI